MRRFLVSLLAGLTIWTMGPSLGGSHSARAANTEVDYFGTNLFLGMAYHRWGCVLNGPYSNSTVQTNNTYQGFSNTQQCFTGHTWATTNASASAYYGCTSSTTLDKANGCAAVVPGGYTVKNTSKTYQVTTTSGYQDDSYLGYYYGAANYDFGTPIVGSNATVLNNYSHSLQSGYTNNSTADVNTRDPSGALNYCSYNVLTNCNSDCWINDFSVRQAGTGYTIPTLSPCW